MATNIGISSIVAEGARHRPVLDMSVWFKEIVAEEWLTDYDGALEAARWSQIPVLAAFTGHPWCGPCGRLQQEVFDSWMFQQWAPTRVVLLSVNDPDANPPRPHPFDRHAISGVPTVVGLDSNGTELGRLRGYASGMGAQLWIAAFEREIGWRR